MKPYLLDVNVLLALAWAGHLHHEAAYAWFLRRRSAGFTTCPLTQAGFVRVSSNPKFTRDAVTPVEAARLLDLITALPEHQFWPDDLPFSAVMERHGMLTGHRQVTDAYLLTLAGAHGGILATLDRGVLALVGPAHDAGQLVELVGSE